MVLQYLSSITSLLPHVKIPVPLRFAPGYSLNVFVDEELGLPLGVAEPELQRFFGNLSAGTVIFDVGAHIGLYTILAGRSSESEVHAFEPHPRNFERLNENVSANQMEEQVTAINAVVSNSVGEVDFFFSNEDCQHSLVSKDGERRAVNSVTLSSYCRDAGVSPDLIKIDVEGGGHLVIDGASEVLSDHPDWLVEIHSDKETTAFREAFQSHGYRIVEFGNGHWFATTENH